MLILSLAIIPLLVVPLVVELPPGTETVTEVIRNRIARHANLRP
jgi:hypothetical protein